MLSYTTKRRCVACTSTLNATFTPLCTKYSSNLFTPSQQHRAICDMLQDRQVSAQVLQAADSRHLCRQARVEALHCVLEGAQLAAAQRRAVHILSKHLQVRMRCSQPGLVCLWRSGLSAPVKWQSSQYMQCALRADLYQQQVADRLAQPRGKIACQVQLTQPGKMQALHTCCNACRLGDCMIASSRVRVLGVNVTCACACGAERFVGCSASCGSCSSS
jgi:hypothetical protein